MKFARKSLPPSMRNFLNPLKLKILRSLKTVFWLTWKLEREIRTRSVFKTQKFLIHLISLCRNKRLKTNRTHFQSRAQRAIQQGTKQEDIESQKMSFEARIQGEARKANSVCQNRRERKGRCNNEDLARAASQEAMMMRKDPTTYIKELSKDRGNCA